MQCTWTVISCYHVQTLEWSPPMWSATSLFGHLSNNWAWLSLMRIDWHKQELGQSWECSTELIWTTVAHGKIFIVAHKLVKIISFQQLSRCAKS